MAEYAAMMAEARFPVEEICESVKYVHSFKRCSNGGSLGRPRVTDFDIRKMCYIAGSKVELSDSTVKYLLSRPFELPSSIRQRNGGRPRGCFGWWFQYSSNEYKAFEEMTALSLPGYWGKFEVGAYCHYLSYAECTTFE